MMRRLAYLDLLRVFSVLLVMYGHFVLVAGGAEVVPGVINSELESLPLIDSAQWKAYIFEIFLIEKFSTQSAVLGVTLFFLITGYLMPLMLERYSRAEFLLNRVFRIFPTLIAAVALLGPFLWFTQEINFTAKSYLASVTLTYLWVGVVPVAGVLWTLVIEAMFYLIVALFGVFTLRKLVLLQALLLLVVLLGVLYREYYYLWLAAHQARFLLCITLGSALFLAEKEEEVRSRLATAVPSIVFSYMSFQLFKLGQVDASMYESLGTHLLSVAIFATALGFFRVFDICLPRAVSSLADLVYPLYLIHVSIGFVTIAFLRVYVSEPYLLLASALVTSLSVSMMLNRLIERPAIGFGRKIIQRYLRA